MGTGVGCHCSFLLKSLGYTWRASAPVKGHREAMAEDTTGWISYKIRCTGKYRHEQSACKNCRPLCLASILFHSIVLAVLLVGFPPGIADSLEQQGPVRLLPLAGKESDLPMAAEFNGTSACAEVLGRLSSTCVKGKSGAE